jgi:Pregnancy-associated plasma protein-A/Secretion system C-terminal sorting domain
MKIYHLFFAMLLYSTTATAQQFKKTPVNRCATMQVLQQKFARNPQFKKSFESERAVFQQKVNAKINAIQNRQQLAVTIPVVFHVVLNNKPQQVSTAQLQAQLDTLNRDFSGTNGSIVNVPSYFQSLIGKSGLQFCFAKRDPDGQPSTGINYYNTTQTSFSTNDFVKRAVTGGADAWNTSQYLNIWVCALSNDILGYATFPQDNVPDEQGIVIDYRSLPGGAYINFNGGKTLTHEAGHYFDLYHIWGDDDGACTGTDFIGDTPNQADETAGSPTGIKTDTCTKTAPGIMYQNYMDYTDDRSLLLFTTQQVTRMEAAVSNYRLAFATSPGCTPVVLKNYDAQLRAVNEPQQRVCAATLTPNVTIRNLGAQTITSLTIYARIDNGPPVLFNWTGNLPSLASANVTLNNITTATGNYTFTVYTVNPNNVADENKSNDTASVNYTYQLPVTTNIQEGFESAGFPPAGWDVVNTDKGITWQRATGTAKTGNASVFINNFLNSGIGQKDYLRLPESDVTALDSLFLSFQVAAAAFTSINIANNLWDTLEVIVSSDCGKTYTSVYKKWGPILVTNTNPVENFFTPTANQWRKDSVNLTAYIGQGPLLVAFLNTTGYENNIYLDDINLRRVNINPNLKAKGILVTPNPASGNITVQFYPQPANLKAIQIFNASGQKIRETIINATAASSYYNYDVSANAAGIYVIKIIFNNRVEYRRIIKTGK